MIRLYRTRQLKGKIYPTGEFSFGYDSANYVVEKRKSTLYDRLQALSHHLLREDDGEPWGLLPLDVAQVYCPSEVLGQEERLTLGLSTSRNQHNRPRRYGAKGMTSYGKKMVKSGAYLLQEKYGKDKLRFLTYTLPAMSEVFRWYVHENWAYFVKSLMQQLIRELGRNGGQIFDYVTVTEVQEKRLKSFGTVYLHLHIVLIGGGERGRNLISSARSDRILGKLLRTMAKRCQKETGHLPGRWETRENLSGRLERVKRCVVGYLGKYLSKGSRHNNAVPDGERVRYYPRQWWTISNRLRREIKERIVNGATALFSLIESDEKVREDWVVWMLPITKVWNDKVYTLGYTGRLRKGWESLLEASEPEVPPVPPSPNEVTLDPNARLRIRRRRIRPVSSALASLAVVPHVVKSIEGQERAIANEGQSV